MQNYRVSIRSKVTKRRPKKAVPTAPMTDKQYIAHLEQQILTVLPKALCSIVAGYLNAVNERLYGSVMYELKKLRAMSHRGIDVRYALPTRPPGVIRALVMSLRSHEKMSDSMPILGYFNEDECELQNSLVNPYGLFIKHMFAFNRLEYRV